MKKLIILLILLCSFMRMEAQNITAAEYFLDTDPGIGNGTAILVNAAGNIAKDSFNINLSPLSPGFHKVY